MHDEIGVRREVIERGLDQFPDRLSRRQAFEIELTFLLADIGVNPFEHGEIERVLVAEIMVDELLVDTGALCDLVDAGAGKAVPGELLARRGEQLLACGDRVAPLRHGVA
ncbi:hypothetical protein ACVWXL_002908 [Bradyrhizobium sp. GM22.5]